MGHHRGRSGHDHGMAKPRSIAVKRGARLLISPGAALGGALLAALIFLSAAWLTPAWAGGQGFALVVGVGSFQDRNFTDLRYAASDARQMAAYLADPKGGGFNPKNITILINQEATKANILKAAASMAKRAKPDDTVILYCSSHGVYTENHEAGVVCYDSRSTGETGPYGPVARSGSVLTRQNLRRFLRFLPARKRAVVLDVCNGAAATAGLSCLPPKLDGYPPDSEDETGPDKFAGPGAGEDQVTLVLASSLGKENAWESRQLGASIFSYFLLRGLRIYNGDLVEAFYYARENTRSRSSEEKGWCQVPYMIQQPPWRRLILAPPGKG
jgi:hypothetical protein